MKFTEVIMRGLNTVQGRARIGFLLASGGLACAVALVPAAFLAPFYHGERAYSDGVITALPSKTLVEMNGLWVVALLCVPLFLSLTTWIGLSLRRTRDGALGRWLTRSALGSLCAFALIGSTGIGLLVLPSALLLVAAAKLIPARPTTPGPGNPV